MARPSRSLPFPGRHVTNVIDVSVALCALDNAQPVVTSDPDDLRAIEPSLSLTSP
jgi:hypothetical protein